MCSIPYFRRIPCARWKLNPEEIDASGLRERVVLGRLEVRQLLLNRPKPQSFSAIRKWQPTVSFNRRCPDSANFDARLWLQDRPACSTTCCAISAQGCNIEVLLIDTEAA